MMEVALRDDQQAAAQRRCEQERGRVPDLLDRISAAHDASLDDEHETCRGLLRECLASLILTSTAPSAPAAPAEPVKLPYPDKIGVSPDGISYHSDDCIRTYGDAREAAGYARGLEVASRGGA